MNRNSDGWDKHLFDVEPGGECHVLCRLYDVLRRLYEIEGECGILRRPYGVEVYHVGSIKTVVDHVTNKQVLLNDSFSST